MFALLLACSAPEDTGFDPKPEPEGPPTATFPSFYGEVPKNLLIVSVDTFRRDLLTRYGGVGDASFLDELIAEGVVLDDHRSCSNWTFPSVMCATQGVTNIEAGYVPDLRYPGEAMMPDEPRTLAARLSDVGYRTTLVTSNSWFSADHNSDSGFSYSERPTDRRTTSVFERGRELLRTGKEEGVERWYLHLHIKEPHPPYAPPEEYLSALEGLDPIDYDFTDSEEQYDMHDEWPEMTAEEQALVLQHLLIRYHADVRWMSDQLREQFAALEGGGWLDDTLVLFWVDHGEQFWEHGEQTHAYHLHNEENDGVAFFWARNIVTDAWPEPTSHIDLAPTVLDLLGVDDTAGMTGIPVGQADPTRDVHLTALARLGAVQAVVKEGWKLIYRWSTGERLLYDTVNDPLELTDLYSPTHPRAAELEALLQVQVSALQPLAPLHTPN
jgi:arylsulfatase A-like enzyme